MCSGHPCGRHAFILIVISGLLGDDCFATGLLVIILGAYSLAGFFFARWLFFRAQDLQWSGGAIVLPEIRGLKWWGERPREPRAGLDDGSVVALPRRIWRPHAALWWKEIQLHQSQFIFAGVLLLLHLGVLAARTFGNFRKNSSTEFILEIFWGLWLVLPLLTGAAAVSEERKLGTQTWQLCLPVRRRTQFAVKFRVALLLSVLFGAVMPVLLEGQRILPNLHLLPGGMTINHLLLAQASTATCFFWSCMEMLNLLSPVLLLAGMALAIGAIAFYTSTLSRNTLQALAPSVLGIILFTFLLFNAQSPELLFRAYDGKYLFHLWHGPLIYFTGLPSFFLALTLLAYWNSQQPAPGLASGRRNILVFTGALLAIIIVTSATYHRAWEKLTPFEPVHGAARLSRTSPPALKNDFSSLIVRLPDGRIWSNDYGFSFNVANPLAFLLANARMECLGRNTFYAGSNWVTLRRNWRGELVGLKSDGTLWVSAKPQSFRWEWVGGRDAFYKPGDLVRFGSETNWSSQVWHAYSLLLVKTDGTLWRWGPKEWKNKTYKDWPGLRAFTPQQVGTQTNWAEVFLTDNRPCLRKTDGTVWSAWPDSYYKWLIEEIEPGFTIQHLPYLELGIWRSTTERWDGLNCVVGIRSDGTFRFRAEQQLNKKSNAFVLTPVDYQFGTGTNWLAVAGRGENLVTLKDDGTLWVWNFYHDSRRGWDCQRDEQEMLAVKPVLLGTHTDWVAITEAPGGIVSLAADGGLWYWPLDSTRKLSSNYGNWDGNGVFWDNNNDRYLEPLLDISRKPQFLGNIFGQAD